MNADTTVHLAHVQAFFYKLESLAGENIILLYLFGKKNNKITSRCLSNFKGPIVSYFSAALSCEQRPFFLVTNFSTKNSKNKRAINNRRLLVPAVFHLVHPVGKRQLNTSQIDKKLCQLQSLQ